MTEPESEWTCKGFNDVFNELIKQDITYIQAYIQAEEMHVQRFGKIRFSSYESFRNSRRNLLFKNKS